MITIRGTERNNIVDNDIKITTTSKNIKERIIPEIIDSNNNEIVLISRNNIDAHFFIINQEKTVKANLLSSLI